MVRPILTRSPLTLASLHWLLTLTVLIVQSPSMFAQADLELLDAEQAAFRQAVAKASGAVVQIETFGGLERVGDDLVAEGPTTGTVVSEDGWIVSSLYAFRGQPASILVSLPEGKRTAAKIVARDHGREIVLLKAEEVSDLPVAVACPKSEVVVGQWSIALGKTYDKKSVSQSVGIISALGRAYNRAVQTDAKISPVNYGGPLIDLQGRVVGILAPISPNTFMEGDSSQLYDSGVGFAVPLQDILDRLPTMKEGQDVHPGKLGIVPEDSNEIAGPVKIIGAMPGSPAAKVGVKSGDVMVSASGQPVRMMAQLQQALGTIDAGQEFQFTVDRNGTKIDLKCPLIAEIPSYRQRFIGIRVEEQKTKEGEKEKISLIVREVETDSPADKAGVKAGMQILKCANDEIASEKDLRQRIAVAELDEPLELTVLDGEQTKSVKLNVIVWPNQLPQSLPEVDEGVEDSMVVEISEMTLGDFPNKVFVMIPPLAKERKLGVLVFFPEPGDVNRNTLQNIWQAFARDQGWLVAVIPSANPTQWSREEVALSERVITRLENSYNLETSCIVVGGMGAGGGMALRAAAADLERVTGVLLIGTATGGLSLRQSNSPLLSLQFMFAGKPDQYEGTIEKLEKAGYSAYLAPMAEFVPGKWELVPLEAITRWMEGLSRL